MFKHGLKKAVEKFNRYLLSIPQDERNYILIVNTQKNRSDRWVSKLAEDYLQIAPKEIVDMDSLPQYKPTNDVKHMVFIDDASYSKTSQFS